MSTIIRPAVAGDQGTLFSLIHELAVFERLENQVSGSDTELGLHLFGPQPAAWALLALEGEQAIGFALYFQTFSTFLTRPGIYLEDLFVRESHRGRGVGRALLQAVAGVAVARGAGRLEWAVLDWNERAIRFYEKAGATVLPDWRICRTSGAALLKLAHSD